MLSKVTKFIKDKSLIMGAAICLTLSVVLAVIDRVAAATLCAALFVVLSLFHILPQLEYFKALGVEAKLRARLSEAEELMDLLRRSAVNSARLVYHTLSWGQRMGGGRLEDRQIIADEVDGILRSLTVSEKMIADLKEDHIMFIGWDMMGRFDRVVTRTIDHFRNSMANEANQVRSKGDADKAAMIDTKAEELQNWTLKKVDLDRFSNNNILEYLHDRIPSADIIGEGASKLNWIAEEMSRVVDECVKMGRATEEVGRIFEIPYDSILDEYYRILREIVAHSSSGGVGS